MPNQLFLGLILLFLMPISLATETKKMEPKTTKTKTTETKTMEPKSSAVKLETSLGDIVIKLNAEKAPKTTENFVNYVNDGFYDGTIFHRVIKGFMAQGGGFGKDYEQKQVKAQIRNEADNGLKNNRGTIAMARTSDPHSATAQFFINYSDNSFLNFKSQTAQGWGYTVFGEVTEGMSVVDDMANVQTGSGGQFSSDVPQTPIVIKKASVLAK